MAKIDDSVKKKVPELRFKGFTDDWEERKLGQYTKLITKGTTPKDKTGIGDVNFVKVENITNGKIYPINKIKQHEHDNYLKRSRLEEKDILFSIAGTLGRTAIVNKSILPANTNQALAIIRGYDFDTNFLITSLAGNVVKEYIRRNPTVGAQPNLSLEQVGNLLVNTPNAEEQQKIGSFFKQLDDTIALHQRKLDLLKEQKKGYLQKMFPKNGAKVPELRFAGFADDWEERKSKDIFKPKIRKGEPDLPVLSVTQTSGVVYRDEVGIDIKYDISTLKNYKVIEPNDFVISLRSFQGGFELSDKLGITSPAYTIFVPKSPEEQNNLFWRIQFKRFQFIQSLKTVTFGIRDGKSISFNEFGDLKIKFPSNILEQQKIGAFFKKLDDTIALHQRKLDLLKEQKKGFLQKMFV